MRYLLPVCAAIAVISGIVSVKLWQDLRSERQLTARLQTQLSESNGTADRLSAELTRRANTVAAPVAATAPVHDTKAEAPKPTQPALPASLLASLTQERDLLKDPEYRKARLAQTRLNMARNYPGLAEELGLSDKEADRLLYLLAENQMSMSAEFSFITVAAGDDPAARQEAMRRQTAVQREQQDAVHALLGDGKYAQYQEYQQTLPARSRVTSFGTTLAQAGQPLTDAQTRTLTTAMIADQQRQRQEAQTMARTVGNPADPGFRARLIEESTKRQEESNRRILEAAAPALNAKQLTALREQFEQDDAMRRASNRLQLERERVQPQPAAIQ